ncbi:MAG TPA: cytochrome c [Steroidobacteraceae bacterium]
MARAKIPHRYKILFIAIGACALLLSGAFGTLVILLSGAYSTAATKQHFWITYRLLETGLKYSVAAAADDIVVPDLSHVASIEVGYACYRQHCISCHGAPGIPSASWGRGQLPGPSNLAQSGREWPAHHLFYVIKKGIRMSGMPAWEFAISEEGIWSTVLFVRFLPQQTRASYEQLAAEAQEVSCPRPVRAPPYSKELAQITLRQYSCDTCHIIDDLVGPYARIGPPLTNWSRRKMIAGVLPNTEENLIRWIRDPQGVSPATLMPDLEVTEAHAQIMARYLLETDE